MDYDDFDAQAGSHLPAFHLTPTTVVHGFDAAIEVDSSAGVGVYGGGALDDSDSPDMYVPEVIQKFVLYFHKQIQDRNVAEIHFIYENTFNKLTDRFFKSSPWPSADAVAPLVDEDPVFMMLYKELYYRHIYAKLQPTLDQRFESWENYGVIFDFLLTQPASALAETPLALPDQWVWDIVDEYIYQFQDFCRWRSRLKTKTVDEVEQLKENGQLYSAVTVLRTLRQLVTRSGITGSLAAEGACSQESADATAAVAGMPGATRSDADGAFAKSPLYRMLGYFALVGQLRVHCLLGDYRTALRCVACVDLAKRGLFTRVTACHIAVCYYVGWCYLMIRRYVDATRTFSSVLIFLSRTKAYLSRSSNYDAILKKNEQMHGALAICLCLCPQPAVDDNLVSALNDKFADKIARMQRGDESAFEDVFSFACPKFVAPCAPNYDDAAAEYSFHEAYRLQLRLFLGEVRQQALLPTLRSYLKLYSAIDTAKLASFLDLPPGACHAQLQALKHKSHAKIWSGGEPLSGSPASSPTELNFFVASDVVHVISNAVTKRYSDYFTRQSIKFEEMMAALTPQAKAHVGPKAAA